MKKLFALTLILSLTMAAYSQNARKGPDGNYFALQRSAIGGDSTATGNYFTDTKGEKYPVFLNYKGKLYYLRTSKAGKVFRSYLKLEGEKL